jgi:hypothetical protein
MNAIRFLGTLACIAALGSPACTSHAMPPARPSRVPLSAVWTGGADGGAFIDCHVRTDGLNDCTVYNDGTGDVYMQGTFELKGTARGATDAELHYSFADGDRIGLLGGGFLIPHPAESPMPDSEPVGEGDVGYPLKGFIGYTNTGNPIAGMTVECYKGGWKRRVGSTTTDATGHFCFPELPEGTYQIKASQPHFFTVKTAVNITRKSKNFLDLVEEGK